MGDRISCIGVLTCANHRNVFQKWCENRCISLEIRDSSEWSVKQNLQDFEALSVDKIVVDDSALVTEEDEKELKNYLGHLISRGIEVIFIGKSERTKNDDYVEQIFNLGVMNILLSRYYQTDLDAMKKIFDEMLETTYSENKLDQLFENYPEEKKKKFFGKTPDTEIKDVLNDVSQDIKQDKKNQTFHSEEELMNRLREEAKGENSSLDVKSENLLDKEDTNLEHFAETTTNDYVREEVQNSNTSNVITSEENSVVINEQKLEELFDSLQKRIEAVEENCLNMISSSINQENSSDNEKHKVDTPLPKTTIAITGMSAAGKTRLAFELAYACKQAFSMLRVGIILNSRDVQAIRELLKIEDGCLTHKNINLYGPKDEPNDDILISDLGNSNYLSKNNNLRKKYSEADYRIAVYNGEPWEIDKLVKLNKDLETLKDSSTRTLIWCNHDASSAISDVVGSLIDGNDCYLHLDYFARQNFFDDQNNEANENLLAFVKKLLSEKYCEATETQTNNSEVIENG